ncbi:hypothetical protein UFOVP206_58 [uncultured Caudovirales phage]|uniref:Uncharacterized protein n=1 Tax=uncultured Caudovirales phage TaxID=2100421 RepID=A0A6J7WMS8_9CAUD|nr:hypothetical protein UFOVP206_58 [uncultured Caudovirales phage]
MTPKEKAKELMNRFNNEYFPELKEYIIYQPLEESKRCALIAVDEIIKETPQLTPEETFIDGSCGVDYFINDRFEYWLEVKQEIEKL